MTIKELEDVNFGIGGKTIDKTKKEYFEKINKYGKLLYYTINI